MRRKRDTQGWIEFQPSSLKLTNEYYARYEAISDILDETPRLLDLVHGDLRAALEDENRESKRRGGFVYTSEMVLRMALCQVLEGASLRGVVVRVDDSHYLRRFTRIHEGPMMGHTALCQLRNAIQPETWKAMNESLAQAAVKCELITGAELRLDTTAVETNIHWPTDSSLLWDGYRTLGRLIGEVRAIFPEAVRSGRVHLDQTKRLVTKIARKAQHKGRKAKDTAFPSAQVDWTLRGAGPGVGGHALAYDPQQGGLLLFGGQTQTGVFTAVMRAETWLWNGEVWEQLAPANRPPARQGHRLATHANDSSVVLFGGNGEGGEMFDDTWEWNGSNWRLVPSAISPEPRAGHAMTYDAARGQILLFGGTPGASPAFGDTWAREDGQWTRLSPEHEPPARAYAAMTYDPVRRRVVLFGGLRENLTCGHQDTWEWDGEDWTLRGIGTGPSPRGDAAMAYDPARRASVLYGGFCLTTSAFQDTWEWNGSAWHPLPGEGPASRFGTAVAYDVARHELVLTGGTLCGLFFCNTYADTWVLRHERVRRSPAISGFMTR